MHWKIVLSLLLILVLVGALFATNFGQNYIDFLRRSVGNFVMPLDFFHPSGDQFSFSLSSNKAPYHGLNLAVVNGTFISNSICATNVKVNDVYVNVAGSNCSISMQDARGNFEITAAGNLIVSADTNYLAVDDSSFSGKLHVDVEVIPMSYVIVGINQDKVSLTGMNGEFERFGQNGDIAQSNNLKNESITIYNFMGILQLKDSSMKLQGFASGVEASDFKIPK